MVRELLGNIRGPRGSEGPKGEDGGFNGETIGVNNLINLSELTTYDDTSTIEVDIETGIINYSNASYYIRQTRHLNKGVYSFTIKDYTSHSSAYGGRIRFEVNDPSTNTRAVNYDTQKGEVVVFDIPESREYHINMRVSGVDRVSGFLEKPILVEGEYPVAWHMGESDNSYTSDYFRGRMYATGIVSKTNTPFSISLLETTGGFKNNSDSITLGSGTYLFNSRLSISFAGSEDVLHMSMYKNDERIARFRNRATFTLSSTYVVKAVEGDTLRFEYYYDGVPATESTMFQRDDRTEFTITKL